MTKLELSQARIRSRRVRQGSAQTHRASPLIGSRAGFRCVRADLTHPTKVTLGKTH
jgi:hypothetical protein